MQDDLKYKHNEVVNHGKYNHVSAPRTYSSHSMVSKKGGRKGKEGGKEIWKHNSSLSNILVCKQNLNKEEGFVLIDTMDQDLSGKLKITNY